MKNKAILKNLYMLALLVLVLNPVYGFAINSTTEDGNSGIPDILKTYRSLVDDPKNKIVLKKISVIDSDCGISKMHKVLVGGIMVRLPEGTYSKYHPDALGLESVIWIKENSEFRVFVYTDLKLHLAPVKDIYMIDGELVELKDLFQELSEIKLNPIAIEKDVDMGYLVKSIMLFLIKKPYLVKTVKYYDMIDSRGNKVYVFYGDKAEEGVSIFVSQNDKYVVLKVFGIDSDDLVCMIDSIGNL